MRKNFLLLLIISLSVLTVFPRITNAQNAACTGTCKSGCAATEDRIGSCPNRGTPALCAPKTCQGQTGACAGTCKSGCAATEDRIGSCPNRGTPALCAPKTCGGGTPAPNPGGTPAPTPGGTPAPNPGGTPAPNPGGTTTPTLGGPIMISFPPPTQYTTVDEFLTSVLGFARNIVVILALVFLVIGGLLYITSAGNDKRIGAAKAAITAALIGLAIVMVAPSFLKELGTVLGWDNSASLPSNTLTLTEIATNVLNFLLAIVGILAIIMFLVGAVMYFLSAGDEKRANTGKDIVKYSIIGIIVTFSALVIVKQIAQFFQ